MKKIYLKRIAALFAVFMLAFAPLLASIPVQAAPEGNFFTNDVTSASDYISQDQMQELNDKAAAIQKKHNCGVYMIFLNDFSQSGYSDIFDYGKQLYLSNDFGCNDGKDGILLIVDYVSRKYGLVTHGDPNKVSYGLTAFTDYGQSVIIDSFLGYLKNSDWYGAYDSFLDKADELMDLADAGTPLDVEPEEPTPLPMRLLFSILPAGIVSLLVSSGRVSGMKAAMKTARIATNASAYITEDGLQLTSSNDEFISHHVVRTPIARNNDRGGDGGGGGGTTFDSDGFSGKSGSF